MTDNQITQIVQDALQQIASSGSPPKVQWEGSPYGLMNKLQIDQRGNVGERIIVRLLENLGKKVHYNENTTDEEKDWDIICERFSYEIKTASLGRNGRTFQHEHIYSTRNYDGLIFVDLTPKDMYITCWAKKDINWSDLHRRKDSSFYKWDTNLSPRSKHSVANNQITTLNDFRRRFEEMEASIDTHGFKVRESL